ncbi:MAG: PEP-CTERM sorting domain-containing protein [Sedimenticola sp.]
MKAIRLLSSTVLLLAPFTASAVVIDNDISAGTVGHWSVDVTTGGESRDADLTANRFSSGDTFTEDVLYDYFTYVDTGSGGVRLSGTAPVSTGDDEVTSTGAFTGSAGNTINWSAVSSIADGSSIMYNTFTFTAETGLLGDLRLFQYMDEDIESVSDDVFFTRGSVAGLDLELYTVDDSEVYGVSHSGAFDVTQGLVESTFAGWAACTYNTMKPAITAGTQAVSTSGEICVGLPGYLHPQVGSAYGPRDIVSVLAWDAVSTATSATIITTIGGVADFRDIDRDLPEPATLALMGLGLAGIGFARKKKQA